jgi:hypothetical protein
MGNVILALLLTTVAACAQEPADDPSQLAAELDNGKADGLSWRSVVRCGGVHIDSAEPSYGFQLVIDDAGAARYLRDRLDKAIVDDPFKPSWGMTKGGAITPARDDEMVVRLSGFNQFSGNPRVDFSASMSLTTGNEIRADVSRYTWEQQEGPGLYRKYTDLVVRIVRNGYREVIHHQGLSGDPDWDEYTGNGWNEWEVANWTFRGCRNE